MHLAPRSLRSNVRSLLIINGLILLFLVSRIFDLTTQLNDGALMQWAVTRSEVEGAATGSADALAGTQIPKIIHQTYRTTDVPLRWRDAIDSITASNPDYQYVLWTDESARDFLAQHYPWFLDTFDNYKYPIMRADALRYFVLYHYGGFYIDLDVGVKTSLDPLRGLPSLFYKTSPTGVSNDIMACIPGHGFMEFVIRNLQSYNCNYFVPYLTVMYSTGPLFLSVVLQRYNMWTTRSGNDVTRIFVLRDSPDSLWKPLADFVFHLDGSTWHEGDAPLFTLINKHLLLSIFLITVTIIVTLGSIFYIELWLLKIVVKLVLPRRCSQPAQSRLKQA